MEIQGHIFQQALLEHRLTEYVHPGDSIPDTMLVPIHYAAVLAGECLEAIRNLREEVLLVTSA